MKTIVKLKFGSHLYGTNTKDSDTDYKGIFMPSKEQILLGRIPKCYSENTKMGTGKNTSGDTDIEIYSLHYFLELACQGQTVAIDMLHAPLKMIEKMSPTWCRIVAERKRFITKNMQAFLGYAMRQASKYGIKGSRLAAAKKVIIWIANNIKSQHIYYEYKLKDFWDELPEGEHIRKIPITDSPVITLKEMKQYRPIRTYEVCGKKIQETVTFDYLLDVIMKFYDSYGARAKQAEQNKGIDFKAVSHAIRAAMQLEELYTTGKIIFPLRKANILRDIKMGKLDYKNQVAPMLEEYIERVQKLADVSTYLKDVDRKYWEKFIINEVWRELNGK